ncbi:uncharacterized protein I206_102464 [Kwoniella pini CBS 10737]|uniref:Uncharacterized protein n=1 Tax=Kwoniella pini CBS 10737 TaxID=1296096 RepID=A0A1B9I5G3_9TREE|nr:uncharacterized protein I206_02815 [Kwoniella pini CBS 10737]OCF50759.1 hypothetical protein I206_02815 [Kwoniella pini CBS 10737]
MMATHNAFQRKVGWVCHSFNLACLLIALALLLTVLFSPTFSITTGIVKFTSPPKDTYWTDDDPPLRVEMIVGPAGGCISFNHSVPICQTALQYKPPKELNLTRYGHSTDSIGIGTYFAIHYVVTVLLIIETLALFLAPWLLGLYLIDMYFMLLGVFLSIFFMALGYSIMECDAEEVLRDTTPKFDATLQWGYGLVIFSTVFQVLAMILTFLSAGELDDNYVQTQDIESQSTRLIENTK